MAYRYEITVRHDGLHKLRVVRAPNQWQAEAIAEQQTRAWDEQWSRQCEKEQKRAQRESKKVEAERITVEAEEL